MSEPIRISRASVKKPKPKDSELTFGTVFTDHLFVMDFQEEKGWYDPRIEPYQPFSSWKSITDRKSTRLNSSHVEISYAVFCLKKKKIIEIHKTMKLKLKSLITIS